MPSRSAPWAWENNVPIIITPGTLPHHGYLPSSDDRPTVPPSGTVQQPKDRREVSISASGGLLPVLFGRNQTGGLIFRAKPTGDFGETFGIGFKLGHGEFDALEQTVIDPFATVTFYPGTDAQTADPSLGLTQRFPRVAYAVCEFDLGPTGGELTLPQFITRGKKIYDPRTTTTVYSANPALEALCLKTDIWFGQGLALSKFDLPSIEDIADYCEEDVSGTPRFECHIALREGHPFEDWENTILTHFAGHWTFKNGKYRLWSHRPTATVSLAITTDHIAANSTPTLRRGTSGGLLDEPNQITITWVDPDTGFVDKDLPIKSASLEAGTESPRIGSNYQYSGCHIVQQAVRHGYYNLNSILRDLGLTIVGMPSLLGLEIGQRVTVTYEPLGLSARDFTVWDMKEDAGSDLVTLDLIEYSSTIWDTSADGGDGGGSGDGGQPGVGDPVPDVSQLFSINATYDDIAKVKWSNPYRTTETLWGAAAWSTTGFGSAVTSRFNDSNLVTVAFDLSPATDGNARLDCTTAMSMRSLRVTADGYSSTWVVEYSDDDAAWTSAAAFTSSYFVQELGGEGGPGGAWVEWPDLGAHRYWRFRKGSALTSALSVYELQFLKYDTLYTLGTQYEIYRGRGVSGTVAASGAFLNPTSSSPLDLTPYTTTVIDVSGVTYRRLYVTVVVRNAVGRKSAGVYIDVSAAVTALDTTQAVVRMLKVDHATHTATWQLGCLYGDTTRYGSSYWALANVSASPDLTKINDGVTNVKAFDCNAAGATTATLDITGEPKAFCGVDFIVPSATKLFTDHTTSGTYPGSPSPTPGAGPLGVWAAEYWDGAAWVRPPQTIKTSSTVVTYSGRATPADYPSQGWTADKYQITASRIRIEWDPQLYPTARDKWRITQTTTDAIALDVYEIQWLTFTRWIAGVRAFGIYAGLVTSSAGATQATDGGVITPTGKSVAIGAVPADAPALNVDYTFTSASLAAGTVRRTAWPGATGPYINTVGWLDEVTVIPFLEAAEGPALIEGTGRFAWDYGYSKAVGLGE